MNVSLSRRRFLEATAGLSVLGAATPLKARDPSRLAGQPVRYQGETAYATPTICEMCFWRCGILGKTREGKLLNVTGNPDHPLSRGRICARGLSGVQLYYDPDRLKKPLIRIGERGEGRWRTADWEEALDRVAAGIRQCLKKYGPNSIAHFPHGSSARYFKELMKLLGVSRYSSASFGQCRGPRDTGYKLTFGTGPGSPERTDFDETRVILLTGSHIGENVHTSHVRDFSNALSRGAKLIVLDPRYSVAASKADFWFPIRPGTDMAFLLSLINLLIREGNYDHQFVEQHCTGFEELKHAVAYATPKWAASVTELKAEQILQTAKILGDARPRVVIHPGRFSAWHGNDTQRSRAHAILTALLGCWGREGGIFLSSPISLGKLCMDKPGKPVNPPPRHHPFIHEGYPFQEILKASINKTEDPVKLWFLYGTNVLHSMPVPEQTIKALKQLDFVFMTDIQPSEPALYADVILPESIYLERYDAPFKVTSAKQPFIALRQPVVEPLYDTRDPYWITRQLAVRLGLESRMPCQTMEEALDRQFSEIGSTLAEVSRTGFINGHGKPYYSSGAKPRFRTPSGKIELYSHQLAQAGLDPIPRYEELEEVPRKTLRLLSGRSPYHSFTRTMNNMWLTEIMPVNPIWINNKVADFMGLKNGQLVELENRFGKRVGPVPVLVTPGIRHDVVFLAHGWGQVAPDLSIAHKQGASHNNLISCFKEDPATGATGLRCNYVRLVVDNQVVSAPTPEEIGIEPRAEVRPISPEAPVLLPVTPQEPESSGLLMEMEEEEELEEEGC